MNQPETRQPEDIISSFLKSYTSQELIQQPPNTQDVKANVILQLILLNREKIDSVEQNISHFNLSASRLTEETAESDLASTVDNLQSILSLLQVESDSLDNQLAQEIDKIQSMVNTLSDLKMGSSAYNSIDQCSDQLLELKKSLFK